MARNIILRIPKSWSFSAWRAWYECPRKYRMDRAEKVWDERKRRYMPAHPDTSPRRALERGTEVHAIAEGFLRGEVTGMPRDLELFAEEFRELKRLGAKPEEDWTFTEKLKRTKYNDWDYAWCRAKTDAHLLRPPELDIIDFKTGSYPRPERWDYAVKRFFNDAQKRLYAGIGAVFFPKAKKIHTGLWYLDEGEIDEEEFTTKEAKGFMREWTTEARKMLADEEFPATPSETSCKYCRFRTDKGGPCGEWKRA